MSLKIVTVNNLKKEYGVGKKKVVATDNISFDVDDGKVFGILGNNGAGKTTLVKMICGLIKPDKGEIYLNGYNIKDRKSSLKQVSAVLEGNRNIYWRLSVRENMEFFAAINGVKVALIRDRVKFLIKYFDLEEKENTPVRNLSRGMQQKVAVAVSLVTDNPIILLDEPTLGLDVQSSYEVRQLLTKIAKQEGKTILLTTHDMHIVEDICEEVIIINDGKIIAHNQVENLMNLFQVQAYNLIVENRQIESFNTNLANICHSELLIDKAKNRAKISLTLTENNQLYEIFDLLKRDNIKLVSIEQQSINFENVFLKIVGKELAS